MSNIVILKWFENSKYQINQKIYLYPNNQRIHQEYSESYAEFMINLVRVIRYEYREYTIDNSDTIIGDDSYSNGSFLAFIIYDKVKKLCHEFSNNKYNGSLKELQSEIDKLIRQVNPILYDSINGEIEFNSLTNIISKYYDKEKDSKLLKEFLRKRNGRCYAKFVEDITNKVYISFSGYFDVDNIEIANWLGKRINHKFVGYIKDIALDYNATLVTTNYDTSFFKLFEDIITIEYSIDSLISNKIDCNSNYKNNLSCCERKIYGHFNNSTPSGVLYVKYELCDNCILATKYQLKNGNYIKVIGGLV